MAQPEQPPLVVSGSEIDAFNRCPRNWLARWYYGFVPKNPAPTGARNFGTRWHTAWEYHYGHGLDAMAVLDLLYKAELEACPDFEAALRKEWELAKIMAEGYLEWLAETGADATLEVVAVEQDVTVELPGFGGTVLLRAKMDQVVRSHETGLLSFLDHKSVTDFERHELIELDPQMRRYSLIQWLKAGQPAPLVGQPAMIDPNIPLVNGGIVNSARKVKRTAKARPPYFDRHPFRYSHERMAATLAGVQQTVWKIQQARAQLATAGAADDPMAAVNLVQLTTLAPVPITKDCSWRCDLSDGMCQFMDEGTAWMEAFVSGGKYVQGDPYDYYNGEATAALVAAASAG